MITQDDLERIAKENNVSIECVQKAFELYNRLIDENPLAIVFIIKGVLISKAREAIAVVKL